MKKRIIIAACCACCSWAANSETGMSIPVAGIADHVVQGTVLPPIVTWVDKPMALNDDGKIPAGEVGRFEIRLISDPAKGRGIVFADKCGVGAKTNLTFVNETDLAHNVAGHEKASFTGVPSVSGDLITGSGVAGKIDALSGVKTFTDGTDWFHPTTSKDEQITVTINNPEATAGTPGVYSATWCMMQIVQ